jgi:uncharacterized protein with HEPN domain
MLAAIANIQAFVQGLDQESFAKDGKTLRAVTYEFVVMGEAVARLPEEFWRPTRTCLGGPSRPFGTTPCTSTFA